MLFLPSVASSYGAAVAQSVPGITPVRLSGPLSSAEPRPHFLRFLTDQQPLSSLAVLFLRLLRLCYLGLPTPTAVR